MLLRSASTPVLESQILLPLLVSHTEPLTETKNEGQEAVLSKCVSLPCRASSSTLITCHTNLHTLHANFEVWGSHPEAHGGCALPFGRIRKVSSENDLSSLGASFAPARISGHSLVRDDNSTELLPLCSDFDLDLSCSHVRRKSTRTSQPFNWRRSLASLPNSKLPSLYSFNGDCAILEEAELASSNSSAVSEEEEEERGRRVCVLDKIAFPIIKAVNAKAELANDVAYKIHNSTTREMNMEGVLGCAETGSVDHAKCEMGASFSGRQESYHMPIFYGSSSKFAGREGAMGTATLVHGQTSHSNCELHGDQWGMAPGAGDGGSGTRAPPTTTGGSGGGGEAGGHGRTDVTELHYQNILKNNPGHALILRNYAQYLAEVKHDYHKAEEFFQRAILANPSDGELLGQYAKLLWEVQQDRERAATYFERAVQAAPDNSYVMAAYASFLWSSEEEEEEEQQGVEEVEGSSRVNVPASLFSLVSAGLA